MLQFGGGVTSESKNMLLRLSGKDNEATRKESILLKYAGKAQKIDATEEGTDEGVSINNIKNIPIQRKQRNNLRDIETFKDFPKKGFSEYDSLPITPAVKQSKISEEK